MAGTKRYGSLSVNYHASFNEEMFSDMKFDNAYIISSVAATHYTHNTDTTKNHYADGMNVVTPTDDGKTWYKWNGLYRYNNTDEMKLANRDYSSFSTEYWTVENGEIPVWKTAN